MNGGGNNAILTETMLDPDLDKLISQSFISRLSLTPNICFTNCFVTNV